MWQRFTFYDFRVIGHYLGVLVTLLAVIMAFPLLVAVLFQEWEPAARYLLGVGVVLSSGSALQMLRIEPGHLNKQQAIAVTGFAWIVLALFAAIPMVMSNHYATYGDALFDAVSAFTTTDASIIVGQDHISHADNMWRFMMNFAGGLGLVIVALSFGLFGRISDSSLYSSEGRSEHVVPNVVQTARFIIKFAVIIIVIAMFVLAGILVAGGMRPDRALLHGVWLSMSGFMTAGLAPMSTSVTYYHSVAVEWVLMVLMLFGSISFSLHSQVWHGRTDAFWKDTEVRAGCIFWVTMLVVFTASMSSSALASSLPSLMRSGLFNFVSAATTTGFITLNSNQMGVVFPSGALLVLSLAMAVGGSAGSTAGGIKLRRVGVVAKSAMETLKQALSPDSARIVTTYNHIGRRRLAAPEVKEAMTVFIMFIIMYTIGALAGIAYGYDAVSAITESVAMASNSGITTGISAPDMPGLLKGLYVVEMWAGRLEFVTLIALAIKIVVSLKPRVLERFSRS